MFKADNTGSSAWKRVIDEEGNHIANLDELYNGDWSLVQKNSRDRICNTDFSNSSKAVTWLWKNRLDLGEPFSLYEGKEKFVKKTHIPTEQVTPSQQPSEDLFWDYKK